MKLVSQKTFGEMCHLSRQAINDAARKNKFPVDADNMIDLDNPLVQMFLEERKDRTSPKEPDDLSRRKAEISVQRAFAQTRKTDAEAKLADIKERQLRGALRNARLVDDAMQFFIQSAFNQFRTIKTILPAVISHVMNEGEGSLPGCQQMFLDEVDRIGERIEREWLEAVKEWEEEIVE